MTHSQQPPRSLETLQIQSPCSENWEAMTGDDKRRFCDICDKHVHNLSAMPKKQAEALLDSESLCVRYDRDAAGQIVVLPSRFERLRRAITHSGRVAVAAIVTLAITPWAMAAEKQPCKVEQNKTMRQHTMGKPMTHPRPQEQSEMGDVAAPVKPPQSPVMGGIPPIKPPSEEKPKEESVAPPEHQPLMGLMKMPEDPPVKKPIKVPKKSKRHS